MRLARLARSSSGNASTPRSQEKAGELLVLVGDAEWQRRNVIVDVSVSGLAAQAHDVEPLGGQLLADRLPHPVDQALQGEVLLDCEVGGDLLSVRSGSDQGVTEQGVVAGKEGHGVVVGPHEVAWVVGMAGECLADEAWPFASAPLIGCGVDRLARQRGGGACQHVLDEPGLGLGVAGAIMTELRGQVALEVAVRLGQFGVAKEGVAKGEMPVERGCADGADVQVMGRGAGRVVKASRPGTPRSPSCW